MKESHEYQHLVYSIHSTLMEEKKKKRNNPLTVNPTKWSDTLKQFFELFECVWPFCGVGN